MGHAHRRPPVRISKPTALGERAQADSQLDKEVRSLIERSTAVQGLPFHVQDQAVLARVASLIHALRKREAARHAPEPAGDGPTLRAST
jgi:hypothetical protein